MGLHRSIIDKYLLKNRYHSVDVLRKVYKEKKLSWEAACRIAPFDEKEIANLYPLLLRCPVVVEVCCGSGDFLLEIAKEKKDKIFIGIDVAYPCLERAMKKAYDNDLDNMLFYHGSAMDFFSRDYRLLKNSICMINFPDPWPKKRHHKRRVVKKELAEAIALSMEKGGELFSATDCYGLAQEHYLTIDEVADYQDIGSGVNIQMPNPFYEYRSAYQKKNLAGSEHIYYTAHRKI